MNTLYNILRFIIAATLIFILFECASFSAELTQEPINNTQSHIIPDEGFETPTQAAIAALGAAVDYSRDVEYAGLIIRGVDGKYRYTVPQRGNEEHFTIRVKYYGKIIAIYHTHPGIGADADRFSDADMAVAASFGIDSYIRVVHSNSVYRYTPKSGVTSQIAGPGLCHHHTDCKAYYAALEAAQLKATRGY